MKRIISLLLVIATFLGIFPSSAFADKGQIWSSIIDIATNAANTVSSNAESVYNSTRETLSNISLSDFYNGWNTAAGLFTSNVAAIAGNTYVSSVADSIDKLQSQITTRVQSAGSSIASKAGFAAEEWHAGTFNIDAITKGSSSSAYAPDSNFLGSVDVSLNNGSDAGLKYYSTAEESAKAQARITQDSQALLGKYSEYVKKSGSNISFDDWLASSSINIDDYSELYWEVYRDQVRIIPSDQIDDAKSFLRNAIKKESSKGNANRQAVAESYKDVLENLDDRLRSSDGVESIPLSKREAEAIAKAGLDNDFKPSEFGVTRTSVIKSNYIAKQAFRAGATSAIIESAIIVGPQLYEIIKYLIDTGSINYDQLKETGIDGLSSAADGFLKGSVSNALIIMCNSGKLGSAYVNASPELIGTLSVLVIDAIRYGIKLANCQITMDEYIDIMMLEFIVSAASLGSATLVSALFPGATLAICLGCFVGGLAVSAGYPAGKEFALALIKSSDVSLLVPIQSSANALKGKVSIVFGTISDSLSTIKEINISEIKDKTISVFDFTDK